MSDYTPRTLAYFEAETGDYIIRRAGTNLARLSLQDIDNEEIIHRWALEGMFRAYLAQQDYDNICDGSALPDRAMPVVKPPKAETVKEPKITKLQQAIANVRAWMLRSAVPANEKQTIAAYQAIAMQQVLALSPEALAEAGRNHGVRIELEKLRDVEANVDLWSLFGDVAQAA